MSEKISNIARNTSYFTFALILQKVISFSYFAILARVLIPEDLGKYYFAISFTTIFAIFIDLGQSNVLTREVAKKSDKNESVSEGSILQKENTQTIFSSMLATKLPLSIISILMVVVLAKIMNYPTITLQLVYLSTICMVLDSFTLTFFSVIRGFHNLKYESIASVVFQLIVLGVGLLAIKLKLSLGWIMSSLVFASIFNFIYSAFLLKFKWKLNFSIKTSKALVLAIAKITAPFAVFAILQRMYMYLDSVLLSFLAGDKYVGLYQISFKIIFALQFLPMAFGASLYPAFASYWSRNREQLAITFERAMDYLILISLPISVGTIILADKIVLIFKPEYVAAILSLQIMMSSLVFIFLNYPVGALLNACDKQKINTGNMGIVLIVSILMNFLLIPRFQANGASITVLFTNFLMFVLGMYQVPKIVKYSHKKIILMVLKVLVAVSVMGFLTFALKNILNIFLVVFLSGIVYFVVLLILGGIKKQDIMSIYKSFKKEPVTTS